MYLQTRGHHARSWKRLGGLSGSRRRNQPCQCLDCSLPASRTETVSPGCFKALRFWYFVVQPRKHEQQCTVGPQSVLGVVITEVRKMSMSGNPMAGVESRQEREGRTPWEWREMERRARSIARGSLRPLAADPVATRLWHFETHRVPAGDAQKVQGTRMASG